MFLALTGIDSDGSECEFCFFFSLGSRVADVLSLLFIPCCFFFEATWGFWTRWMRVRRGWKLKIKPTTNKTENPIANGTKSTVAAICFQKKKCFEVMNRSSPDFPLELHTLELTIISRAVVNGKMFGRCAPRMNGIWVGLLFQYSTLSLRYLFFICASAEVMFLATNFTARVFVLESENFCSRNWTLSGCEEFLEKIF